MAALPNFLKDQGIIHTIRENINISEFPKFFENFGSYLKPFTQNANISKMSR